MCGIAGFARQPGASTPAPCVQAVEEMLVQMQHRGKHATGFAAMQDDGKSFIFKKAVEAGIAIASEPWKAAVAAIDDGTIVFQGHVRHSTQAWNKDKDEAAHPFEDGTVVGVHNGVITNQDEIEKHLKLDKRPLAERWDVDSQAAFGALARFKNPADALGMLEGWFALTWTKKKSLYMVKSPGTSLAVAYIPRYRTLFWASESKVLESVLRAKMGAEEVIVIIELAESRLYRYDVTKFSDEGTGVAKTDVKLREAKKYKSDVRWKATQGTAATVAEQTPIQHIWNTIGRLSSRVTDLEAENRELTNSVFDMELRMERYDAVFEEMGWPMPEEDVDTPSVGEEQLSLDTPYRAVCKECGEPGASDDKLLDATNGEFIHENCVFPRTTMRKAVLVRSKKTGEWVTRETERREDAETSGGYYQ